MKLLVTGYARHGKDTTCELLRKHFGMSFESSSYFVAERVLRPYLAKLGFIYNDLDSCYADRVTKRALWYDAIYAYNTPDKARLGRELLAKHDIYCGLRSREEFEALKADNVFTATIWVDRSRHLPPEPVTSMGIRLEDCDYVLDNNTTLGALHCNLIALMERITKETDHAA